MKRSTRVMGDFSLEILQKPTRKERLAAAGKEVDKLTKRRRKVEDGVRQAAAAVLGGHAKTVAAQEVFARHPDPQRQEASDVRERRLNQLTALREVVARRGEAEAPAADVQHLSDDSARRRDEAAQDADAAHQRADRSLEESTTADQFSDDALRTLQSI